MLRALAGIVSAVLRCGAALHAVACCFGSRNIPDLMVMGVSESQLSGSGRHDSRNSLRTEYGAARNPRIFCQVLSITPLRTGVVSRLLAAIPAITPSLFTRYLPDLGLEPVSWVASRLSVNTGIEGRRNYPSAASQALTASSAGTRQKTLQRTLQIPRKGVSANGMATPKS